MIQAWVHRFLHSLVLKERSAAILTASFAFGVYVAFSPYIFLHTVECILFAWAFSLNFPVMLIVSNVVNNPWSMVPLYATDHMVGDWIMTKLMLMDSVACNPGWMCHINEPLQRVTGMQGVSFWAFIIGGNLLGIIFAVIMYFVMKPVFTFLAAKIHTTAVEHSVEKNPSVGK